MTASLEQTIDRPPKKPRTESCGVEQEQQQETDGSLTQTMSQNTRIQRYLIAIEYIGTRFSGSQQQPSCRTVVGVLEEAFLKFVGKPVAILCSSRTDAGVHALSNVCHVDVERISKRKPGDALPPHEPAVVRRAINHFLQKNEGDISVTDVRCIPADFHARYKALERTYFYRILSGSEPLSAFDKDRAWHVQQEINVHAMQEACKILAGHHDFTSFRATGCQAKSPIRTVDELSVTEVLPSPYFPTAAERRQNIPENGDCEVFSRKSDAKPTDGSAYSNGSEADIGFGLKTKHRCFVVTARARSFLYHQVRLLVGVLKNVGTGDLTTEEVRRILDAKDVSQASPMAPACGLYLGHVKYDLSVL